MSTMSLDTGILVAAFREAIQNGNLSKILTPEQKARAKELYQNLRNAEKQAAAVAAPAVAAAEVIATPVSPVSQNEEKYTCSRCQGKGHNVRTCQAVILPVVLPIFPQKVEKVVDVRHCSTCGKAGHYNVTCEKEEKAQVRRCSACDGKGHNARTCPNSSHCGTCGTAGHNSRTCKAA